MLFSQSQQIPFQILLSFHKIIARLEEIAANDQEYFGNYARIVLKKIADHPELRDGINSKHQLEKNEGLISELLVELFPVALTNSEIKAVSMPYLGFIFNLSNRFKDILKDAGNNFQINIRNHNPHQSYIFSCCIILNKFYGTNLDFAKPLFYDIPTAEGYIKHYRILYNIDFLDITPTGKALELTREDIVLLINNYDDLSLWKEKFPPGSWILKGFAIMTLVDVTIENAVSTLKTNLIGSYAGQDMREVLTGIFRSIFKMPDLEIGFTSFKQEKGKLGHMPLNKNVKSYILSDNEEEEISKALCNNSYNKLMLEHTYFSVSDVSAFAAAYPDDELPKRFQAENIQSFILAPVVKNDVLLGVIELASPHKDQLNSVNANKLENVMPYITDTIDRRITEMQDRIRAIIQANYTTLHPSVYWRFRLEAQNYIDAAHAGEKYDLGEIVFKHVYPLYGQVDIKDSSLTRNLSIKNDLLIQLGDLLTILQQLNKTRPRIITADMISALKHHIDELAVEFKADTEYNIEHYLALHIYPLLRDLNAFDDEQVTLIDDYFKQTKTDESWFNVNRRNYEQTIAMVNENLITILDKRQAEAQTVVSHYYERFKTDGVEHNIYAGSSLLQDGKFAMADLRRLRLWELMVLAEMQITHQHLQASLPYQLGVASLILAFGSSISIRFRMDEKHFDVDGAYNVRFEVIKKRIDKAHIKHTDERITANGKIVIVYASEEDELDYREYISILQKARILDSRIEYFDVEELQGVSGLRAIRVATLNNQSTPVEQIDYNSLYQQLSH